jgi:hypothetical protein
MSRVAAWIPHATAMTGVLKQRPAVEISQFATLPNSSPYNVISHTFTHYIHHISNHGATYIVILLYVSSALPCMLMHFF